jgi:2-polyprenyl-3-methyl-5-hydroxy-6-metoxy-1,4-benzoquinol methylase
VRGRRSHRKGHCSYRSRPGGGVNHIQTRTPASRRGPSYSPKRPRLGPADFYRIARGVSYPRLNQRIVDLGEAGALPRGPAESLQLDARYTVRKQPAYYVDSPPPGIEYQPDVYRVVGAVAVELGSRTIVDIGAGSGEKLARLSNRFDLLGLDHGRNLQTARERYPAIDWLEHDIEHDVPLPIERSRLEGATLVCADVIEHLMDPQPLLRKLRAALDEATAIVLSTPDRVLLAGPADSGPPANPCHVREWSQSELARLLRTAGFQHGRVLHTRSHSWTFARRTSLAVIVASASAHLLPRLTMIARFPRLSKVIRPVAIGRWSKLC